MQNKVVVVTGAGRGIGAAAARAFAAAGANVVLMARSLNQISEIAKEIGDSVLAVKCNVADHTAVQAAIAAVISRFGRIDVWINNAGVIGPIGPIANTDPEKWADTVAINLNGVFHGMRGVLPIMRAQGAGTLINLSSGAAINPKPMLAVYSATKAAVLMLTRSAHQEESAHGIRVLGLSPGTVATDMQNAIATGLGISVDQAAGAAHIPPDWVARTLIWMCGPQADRWLGSDVSLRDPDIRKAVGLVK